MKYFQDKSKYNFKIIIFNYQLVNHRLHYKSCYLQKEALRIMYVKENPDRNTQLNISYNIHKLLKELILILFT